MSMFLSNFENLFKTIENYKIGKSGVQNVTKMVKF